MDDFFVLSVFSPTAPSLEVRDLVTGFRTLIQTPLRPLRAHPRRLAVYGLVAGVVTRLDPTGLRPYDACGGAPASTLALTVDGSRLVVSCGSGTIESLDESTGTRLSTFSVGTSPSLGFAINSDGSRALVIRSATSVTELVLYDVASGTEIAAAPMPGGAPPAPFSGPGTGSIWSTVPGGDAVVVSRSWSFDPGPGAPLIFYRRTNLVEFDTLASRTELAVPYGVHSMAISPDGLRAIVASNDIRPGAAIQDLDLRTGQPAVAGEHFERLCVRGRRVSSAATDSAASNRQRSAGHHFVEPSCALTTGGSFRYPRWQPQWRKRSRHSGSRWQRHIVYSGRRPAGTLLHPHDRSELHWDVFTFRRSHRRRAEPVISPDRRPETVDRGLRTSRSTRTACPPRDSAARRRRDPSPSYRGNPRGGSRTLREWRSSARH